MFAYGATGAGKTFTMLGTAEQPGIAYLTIVELLEFIEKSSDMKVTMAASYLEVRELLLFVGYMVQYLKKFTIIVII